MDEMWAHQREAVEWATGRKACLLHMGMGTGKTRVTLEILRAEGLRLVLVCCPLAVIPAWAKQVRLWMPGYRVLAPRKGSSADKAKAIKAALADTTPLIVVVNYESAWRIPGIDKVAWDCLVWDEVHRLKSPSGKASRWAARICAAKPDAKKIGLSGTLLAHSPLDAYAVWRSVESPECPTFGKSFTQFRREWFVTHHMFPSMVLGYRRTAEFGTRIAQTTFHRRSEDVLDLPPIMHERIECDLTPGETRVYREIERDFMATVDSDTVTPANVLVQLTRLMEVVGGTVHLDGRKDATQIDERPAKAAALSDILEDLGKEPVVVFCKYTAHLQACRRVCESLGLTVSELSGQANELAAWQAGETQVLLANTASGGIGVDLTRASYGVFYGVGHSLAEYLQAVARLHRPGQARTTHFYELVATIGGKETVDGRVHDALDKRQEVLDALITGYRAAPTDSRLSA